MKFASYRTRAKKSPQIEKTRRRRNEPEIISKANRVKRFWWVAKQSSLSLSLT